MENNNQARSYGHWKPCEKCGRRSLGQFCSACRTSGKRRVRTTPDDDFQKRTKALSSDGMVEDRKPTIGIGESLVELEAKLKEIDEKAKADFLEAEFRALGFEPVRVNNHVEIPMGYASGESTALLRIIKAE